MKVDRLASTILSTSFVGRRHFDVIFFDVFHLTGLFDPAAAEIAELVRVLDGHVRYRFGDKAELMGAWASARNPSLRSGQAVLGSFKSRTEPEAGGGEGRLGGPWRRQASGVMAAPVARKRGAVGG